MESHPPKLNNTRQLRKPPCLYNSLLDAQEENKRLSLSLRIREFQMERQARMRELFGD